MEIQTIQNIVYHAVAVSRTKKLFYQNLKTLTKTMPTETRKAIARYVTLLRKLNNGGGIDAHEFVNALVLKQSLVQRWKDENKELLESVRKSAKDFYGALQELEKAVEQIQIEVEAQ